MGSIISRSLIMVYGYAYPAYKCFKEVEQTKSDRDQLLFWCHYWILVAMLTVFERVGDPFVSWLPMYREAKLGVFIYLWHPRTKGTTHVYNAYFMPVMKKHENIIDSNLEDIKNRTATTAVLVWQKAAGSGQDKFFEILQYVSSRSAATASSAKSKSGERSATKDN